MFTDAKSAPYLCVDATGVLVQAPERCRHGHFWVMVAPNKHVLYKFSHRHDSDAVDALLAGYAGYLVADAHAVYDHLYATGTVVEVGCWCHGRRYFFKALESDPERAKVALVKIGALFKIERAHADAPRKQREAVRALKSKPIVDDFFEWCKAEEDLVLDESPIAKAIGYALNQQLALRRFLDDGRLPLHNNISELNLRREVVGRRNWLFVGSEDGAKANTVFVSLIASCRMLGASSPTPTCAICSASCRAGRNTGSSSSRLRTGRTPSSRATLSSSSTPTCSAASRSGSRSPDAPRFAIARVSYDLALSMSGTGQTERIQRTSRRARRRRRSAASSCSSRPSPGRSAFRRDPRS